LKKEDIRNDFIIRKFKNTDIESLKKLSFGLIKSQKNVNSLFHNIVITRASNIEDVVNNPNFCIFVAEFNKKLIGYSEVKLEKQNAWFEVQEHALLVDLFIDKSKCKSLNFYSIAFQLYKCCEDWAKERKMKYLCADVYGENTRVRRLSERRGFREYKIKFVKELID